MGSIFSKKPVMNSDEYEKICKRITDLEVNMDKLVSKFMSLRGLIHRKKFDTGMEEAEPTELEEREEVAGELSAPTTSREGRDDPMGRKRIRRIIKLKIVLRQLIFTPESNFICLAQPWRLRSSFYLFISHYY